MLELADGKEEVVAGEVVGLEGYREVLLLQCHDGEVAFRVTVQVQLDPSTRDACKHERNLLNSVAKTT